MAERTLATSRRAVLATTTGLLGGVSGCASLTESETSSKPSESSATDTDEQTATTATSTTGEEFVGRGFQVNAANSGVAPWFGGSSELDVSIFAEFDTALRATPVVGPDLVYAPTDETLHALRTTDGGRAYTASLTENQSGQTDTLGARAGVESAGSQVSIAIDPSPAMLGDAVFAASTDGVVSRFDGESAEPTWRTSLDGARMVASLTPSTVGLVGLDESSVYVLDETNGSVRWQVELLGEDDSFTGTPAIDDGRVVVVSNRGVVAVVEDGTEQWRETGDRGLSASPSIVNDTIYFVSHDGGLRSLDLADGSLRIARDIAGTESSFAITPEYGFVHGEDGVVERFDAATGETDWRVPYAVEMSTLAASAVGSSVGRAASTGTAAQMVSTLDPSPLLAGEQVYVPGVDGVLYVLDAKTGVVVHEVDVATEFDLENPSFSTSFAAGESCLYVGVIDRPNDSHGGYGKSLLLRIEL